MVTLVSLLIAARWRQRSLLESRWFWFVVNNLSGRVIPDDAPQHSVSGPKPKKSKNNKTVRRAGSPIKETGSNLDDPRKFHWGLGPLGKRQWNFSPPWGNKLHLPLFGGRSAPA